MFAIKQLRTALLALTTGLPLAELPPVSAQESGSAAAVKSISSDVNDSIEILTMLAADGISPTSRRLAIQEVNKIADGVSPDKAKPLAALVYLDLAERHGASYIAQYLLNIQESAGDKPIFNDQLVRALRDRQLSYPLERRPADMLRGLLAAKGSDSAIISAEMLQALPPEVFKDLDPYLAAARKAVPGIEGLSISDTALLLVGVAQIEGGQARVLTSEQLSAVWQEIARVSISSQQSAELVIKTLATGFISRIANDRQFSSAWDMEEIKSLLTRAPEEFQRAIAVALLDRDLTRGQREKFLDHLPKELQAKSRSLGKLWDSLGSNQPDRDGSRSGWAAYDTLVSTYTRDWSTRPATEMPPYNQPALITLADLTISLEQPIAYDYRGAFVPSVGWANRLLRGDSGINPEILEDYRALSEDAAKKELALVLKAYIGNQLTETELALGLLVLSLRYPGPIFPQEAKQLLDRFLSDNDLSPLRDIVVGDKPLPDEFSPTTEPLLAPVKLLSSTDRTLSQFASLLLRNMPHTSILQQEVLKVMGALLDDSGIKASSLKNLEQVSPGLRLELLTELRDIELPSEYHKARFDFFLSIIDNLPEDPPLFEAALNALSVIPIPAADAHRVLSGHLMIAERPDLGVAQRIAVIDQLAKLTLADNEQAKRIDLMFKFLDDPMSDESIKGAIIENMARLCIDLWDARHQPLPDISELRIKTRDKLIALIEEHIEKDLAQTIDLLGALSRTRDLRNTPAIGKYAQVIINRSYSTGEEITARIKELAKYSILNYHLPGLAAAFADVVKDTKREGVDRIEVIKEIDNIVTFSAVFTGRMQISEAKIVAKELLEILELPLSNEQDLEMRIISLASFLKLKNTHSLNHEPITLEIFAGLLRNPQMNFERANYLCTEAVEQPEYKELMAKLAQDSAVSEEVRRAIIRSMR